MSISCFIKSISQKIGAALSDNKAKTSVSAIPVEKQEQNSESQNNLNHPNCPKNHETQKTQEVKQEVVIDSDAFLCRNIKITLANHTKDKDLLIGRKLVIWLDCDQLTFDNYNNDSFKHNLLLYLHNEGGYELEQVSFAIGSPSPELRATCICNNAHEYLQVVDDEPVFNPDNISRKAIISIFGQSGSLKKKKYVLSQEEMLKKMISAYNIGFGECPKLSDGSYRENNIAIDDDPESPMAEKNKYVSRRHAHIGFSDTIGFYLQVDVGGTQLAEKRTRILRGDQKIECNDTTAKFPLQTGDRIELGKAVILKFV